MKDTHRVYRGDWLAGMCHFVVQAPGSFPFSHMHAGRPCINTDVLEKVFTAAYRAQMPLSFNAGVGSDACNMAAVRAGWLAGFTGGAHANIASTGAPPWLFFKLTLQATTRRPSSIAAVALYVAIVLEFARRAGLAGGEDGFAAAWRQAGVCMTCGTPCHSQHLHSAELEGFCARSRLSAAVQQEACELAHGFIAMLSPLRWH